MPCDTVVTGTEGLQVDLGECSEVGVQQVESSALICTTADRGPAVDAEPKTRILRT